MYQTTRVRGTDESRNGTEWNQSGRMPSLKSFKTDCALFPTVTQ